MTKKANILIVEDEATIAERIRRLSIAILGRESYRFFIKEDLKEAFSFIQQHKIDLLLLDLNLNGANGFDLLKKAVAHDFHTIIISAYDDQAIRAYEYGVLDFVAKPFGKDRLALAFSRWLNQQPQALHGIRYLAVTSKGISRMIPIEEVIYIKGAGAYSEIFLQNNKKVLHSKSLEKLQQLLPPTFERIHKSYIVEFKNIQRIIIYPGGRYEAELPNGEVLPISRSRYKGLKERGI